MAFTRSAAAGCRHAFRRAAGRALVAAACLVAVAGSAFAQNSGQGGGASKWLYEASVGVLDHDTDDLWSGFSREDGIDLNAELLFAPIAGFWGGTLHPALGGSVNLGGDTSKAYAGLRWRYEFEFGLFAGIGLGGAIHNGDTEFESSDSKALGSRVLFHIPAEIGYRITDEVSASVYFDHVSNRNFADPNEGMDTLGARVGYRF